MPTLAVIKGLIVRHRTFLLMVLHLSQAALANFLAFALRFDGAIPRDQIQLFWRYLPLLLAIRLALYIKAGLHRDIWRYSGIRDLIRLVNAISVGSLIFFFCVRYALGVFKYPRSVYIISWLLLIMMSGGSRLFLRILRDIAQKNRSGGKILIIGAGDAGEMIARDMINNPRYAYDPVGFIDDDPHKTGLRLHGLPIVGTRKQLGAAITKLAPDEILIAMPSANHKTISDIFDQCKSYNLPVKTLPGLSDILDGKVTISNIRPLSLEDLLMREPVNANITAVNRHIRGKKVLVTGAGGSIGSELARQIYSHDPDQIILFDRYENGLYGIDLELKMQKKRPEVISVIGDMCDRNTLSHVFSRYRPQIVYHAAAHKHVPLMEINPIEAVRNNIFGTRNLLEAAESCNTERFVTISTDKAVNPSNVMGASKRVVEFLTLQMNEVSSGNFSVVRFGNVLGSNGSVVPLFRDQLKRGGPLTVTHPEIKRFFMLIPEAVSLVLIAGASDQKGSIFVLDMGTQIPIVTLAENLIRLSGYQPYEDINIVFTGLRPGEKLYEELFDSSETQHESFHEKIMIAQSTAIPSGPELAQQLAVLEQIVRDYSVDSVVPALQKIVPNFRP